jgi:histidinol-phosphate aminotransferase
MTSNPLISPRDHVAHMAAYTLPDISTIVDKKPIVLAQNESIFPPSPRAIEAAATAAASTNLYSDCEWTGLRAAIAGVHGVASDNILVGAGSMELIVGLIRAYAGPGDQVLSTQYGYAFFKAVTLAAEADYATAPEHGLTVSVDEILAAIQPATRIVCVANPGNPTGTHIERSELVRLRDGLDEHILLIIDEAYGEFADHMGEPTFDLATRGNTVILRTFSKAYGLAGMRVGWGVFPPAIAQEVRKLLNPGSVSAPSLAAATKAMEDQNYMRHVCDETARLRQMLTEAARSLGLEATESHTNFILIHFVDEAQALRCDQALRAEGIIFRGMGGYGLANCLRATVPHEDDIMLVINTLQAWHRTED